MSIDFEGQTAIVTGAGRGLGRLYALEIARRGGQVVVNDIGASTMHGGDEDESVAAAVVEEIREHGGAAVGSCASVETPEGAASIVEAALEAFGRVDAVISNAGIYEMASVTDITPERWRAMLAVHLDGGLYLAQPAMRVMKEQGYGRFVFISSQMGAFGQHHNVAYAAAKGGLIAVSNVIAQEGERHGITSNTILPIGRTRMVDESAGERRFTELEERFFERIEPERVVPMAVYFASRACAVSHHNVSAGAGRYARAFMGLTEGWLSDPSEAPATVEDVAARYGVISDTSRFTVPMSAWDEIVELTRRLGIS
jgi:NAD(P)-dependent dehydrogenase (short-subunit alcohol dehydrogenase family)